MTKNADVVTELLDELMLAQNRARDVYRHLDGLQWAGQQRLVEKFLRYVQPEKVDFIANEAARTIYQEKYLLSDVVRKLSKNDVLQLADAEIEYVHAIAAWIQINEILIDEEYYFHSDKRSPLIVDGGINFGLSLYYFKRLYPEARIIGFEPIPPLYEMALRNCRRNGWEGVELHPFALDGTPGEAAMTWSALDSMASSLLHRKRNVGKRYSYETYTAQVVTLSSYLEQEVDLLKLDIEGAEDAVLEESAEHLRNVKNIVLEYHHGFGLPNCRLGRIITLLEGNGFNLDVQRSWSGRLKEVHRPLAETKRDYSLLIVGSRC